MKRELVNRVLRQLDGGPRGVVPHETAPMGQRRLGVTRHNGSQAGFTPATCTSAAMNRPQSSRWAASVRRPLSVMR